MREWEEKLSSLSDHIDRLRAQLDYEEGTSSVPPSFLSSFPPSLPTYRHSNVDCHANST